MFRTVAAFIILLSMSYLTACTSSLTSETISINTKEASSFNALGNIIPNYHKTPPGVARIFPINKDNNDQTFKLNVGDFLLVQLEECREAAFSWSPEPTQGIIKAVGDPQHSYGSLNHAGWIVQKYIASKVGHDTIKFISMKSSESYANPKVFSLYINVVDSNN
jgi:hypothetical protein